MRAARLNGYLGAVPEALTSLANVAVLVLGIWLIVLGEFTPGMLLALRLGGVAEVQEKG